MFLFSSFFCSVLGPAELGQFGGHDLSGEKLCPLGCLRATYFAAVPMIPSEVPQEQLSDPFSFLVGRAERRRVDSLT